MARRVVLEVVVERRCAFDPIADPTPLPLAGRRLGHPDAGAMKAGAGEHVPHVAREPFVVVRDDIRVELALDFVDEVGLPRRDLAGDSGIEAQGASISAAGRVDAEACRSRSADRTAGAQRARRRLPAGTAQQPRLEPGAEARSLPGSRAGRGTSRRRQALGPHAARRKQKRVQLLGREAVGLMFSSQQREARDGLVDLGLHFEREARYRPVVTGVVRATQRSGWTPSSAVQQSPRLSASRPSLGS